METRRIKLVVRVGIGMMKIRGSLRSNGKPTKTTSTIRKISIGITVSDFIKSMWSLKRKLTFSPCD